MDLVVAGWTDSVLGCLVEEELDAERVIRALRPEMMAEELKRTTRLLWDYSRWQATRGRRVVARMAQQASQPMIPRLWSAISASDAYERLVSENVELAQKIHKSRGMRLKGEEGATPEAVEQHETTRWAMTVAGFIAESTLPAKQVAESTEDPSSTWVRLVGNRRSRTLRQSARAWQKFRDWLMVTRGSPWPSSVSQVVDYLEERMLEPCGPTVPGSLLSALQLLETVGGAERERRLGLSPILINVTKNMKKELSVGGPPRRTAPVFTVAMVIAAELVVTDPETEVVLRMMAYILLLMVWGAMRTDDVLWLDRSRTMLSEVGWKSVLVRSKTSGAGRRVRELPVFVSRLASLTGRDWLAEGHYQWQEASKNFPGSLFVCRPVKSAEGFTRKYLDAAGLSTWLKWTLLQLPGVVKRFGKWSAKDHERMIDEEWSSRWSGHSARHCLPSWAAAIGIPPEQRAFLGRWKCGVEVDANSYVLTSRQIVHSAQEAVVKSFCTGTPGFSETEVFEELKIFAADRGLDPTVGLNKHAVWRRKGTVVALFMEYPTLTVEPIPGALGVEEEHAAVTAEEEVQNFPFWVSISRRSGFRRLHKKDGCGVRPESVFKAVEIEKISPEVADKKCQLCFGKQGEQQGSSEDGSTSGSSSTSSDSNENSPMG